jgi:hypothetical protein
VGLCPDEVRVGQADFGEAFELFEGEGEELGGFEFGGDPLGRWGEEAFAVSAERDGGWAFIQMSE